jgi:hypothetical protein
LKASWKFFSEKGKETFIEKNQAIKNKIGTLHIKGTVQRKLRWVKSGINR